MEQEKIVACLQQIPLFQDFTDRNGVLELYRVAPLVKEVTYGVGDCLFGQGDPSDRLYYIVEGQIRLTRFDREGQVLHLGDKGPGDSFGVAGLLVVDFHDVRAEVLALSRILCLERGEFAALLEQRPRLQRRLNLRPDLRRVYAIPRFAWLRDDELPVFVGRRHWFHLIRRIFWLLLLLLVGAIFLVFLSSAAEFTLSFILIVGGLFGIPISGFLVWQIWDWQNDRFVVTTQRIVHIERQGLFRENYEEGALDDIQDVHEARFGLTANILNFGDLILQTAGETVQIDFTGVPAPGRLRELVFRETERQQARQVAFMRGAIREKLEKRLRMAPSSPVIEAAPALPRKVSTLPLVWGAIKDYFFPSSWSVSEDKTIIYWRRFWLPGFIRNLSVSVPFVVIAALGVWYFPEHFSEVTDATVTFWLVLWLLIESVLFAMLLWAIEDWRNDYFQITPTRMIMVNCKPLLLSESRRETILGEIQNISFDVPDIMARFFKYGNVMLETAGATGKFEMKWVRYPQKIQAEISGRKRAFVEKQRKVEAQRRQEELLSWFAVYDDLRQKSSAPADPGEAGTDSPSGQ